MGKGNFFKKRWQVRWGTCRLHGLVNNCAEMPFSHGSTFQFLVGGSGSPDQLRSVGCYADCRMRCWLSKENPPEVAHPSV